MGTVLKSIFNLNQYICHSILHNLLKVALQKKETCLWNILGYNGILCRFGMDVWVIPR